jgi:hypothetical protein
MEPYLVRPRLCRSQVNSASTMIRFVDNFGERSEEPIERYTCLIVPFRNTSGPDVAVPMSGSAFASGSCRKRVLKRPRFASCQVCSAACSTVTALTRCVAPGVSADHVIVAWRAPKWLEASAAAKNAKCGRDATAPRCHLYACAAAQRFLHDRRRRSHSGPAVSNILTRRISRQRDVFGS